MFSILPILLPLNNADYYFIISLKVSDLSDDRELHMKQLSQLHEALQLKCNQLSSTSKQYQTLLDQYHTLQNDYTLLKESQDAARKVRTVRGDVMGIVIRRVWLHL